MWEKIPEATGYPEAYTIVEWADDQSMYLITWDILSTEGTMRAGYSVTENSVQSFLCRQKVVQQAKEEAGVHGVKTRESAEFPS